MSEAFEGTVSWDVPSNTDPTKSYTVSYHAESQVWECECPFIPRGSRKHCSHIMSKQAAVVAGKLELPSAALDEEWGVLTQPGATRRGQAAPFGSEEDWSKEPIGILGRLANGVAPEAIADELEQAKENMARALNAGPGPDDTPAASEAEDVEVPVPPATGVGEPPQDSEGVEADPHELPSGYTVQQQLEGERRAEAEAAALTEAFEQAAQEPLAFEVTNIDSAIAAVYAEVAYVQKQKAAQLTYSFAGEAAIISALRPALVRHGITVHVSKLGRPERERYATKHDTQMVSTILKGRVTFTHAPSGTKRHVWAWGEGSDSGDKSIPKAMTGLYKYAMRQTFNLETGDDPDLQASREQERAANYQQQKEQRENRQARQDALRGRANADTPPWWNWFKEEGKDKGLVAADFTPQLGGQGTLNRVRNWLSTQEPAPTSEADIQKALQSLLSRAADWKAKREGESK